MLAAIVAQSSPSLPTREKRELARLMTGYPLAFESSSRTLKVTAEEISCQTSTVDPTEHLCKLRFERGGAELRGRAANELLATMVSAGVPPDPDLGRIFVQLTDLSCTLTFSELRAKGGNGVACSFTTVTG